MTEKLKNQLEFLAIADSMKQTIVVLVALFTVLSVTACESRPPTQQLEQTTSPTVQAFPTDYSRAYSINITIYGGTATGHNYTVTRSDNWMWSRDEFLSKYDYTKPNQPFLYDPTFSYPDEYLFDALINTMFDDQVYELTEHEHSDQESHYDIVVCDDEGTEIMAFSLFYMKCVKFCDAFYSIAPEIVDHSIPYVDSSPFSASFFMSR